MEGFDEFKAYDKESLFEAIYSKIVTLKKLPKELFRKTFDVISKALVENINYELVDEVLGKELMTNVYLFSGAKTETQIKQMMSAMYKDGKIVPFNEFKQQADAIFKEYNINYLLAEYNTAVGQSQMVSQWAQIYKDKETFPYIQYQTSADQRVSEICRHFDMVTLPVNDPFWKKYSPLNHFQCRCTLIQLSEFDDYELSTKTHVEKAVKDGGENMADIFKINPFHDQVIFSKKHPYFSGTKEYKKQFKD